MKKKMAMVLTVIAMVTTLAGCSQSERVNANLTKEADNFNVVRQLTVMNCIEGDVLFQMTGPHVDHSGYE